MCATTGLTHGGFAVGIDGEPFAPLDEREVQGELAAWFTQSRGEMQITGKNARNLNPLVTSDPTVPGGRSLKFAWWWIWRDRSGPVKYTAFNSRVDRLSHSWKPEFQQRALIPASWYIEKGVRFEHPSQRTMALAAVTSTVVTPDGTELLTYSLVTREAIGRAAEVHDRMPLIVPVDRQDEWLDRSTAGTPALAAAAVHWSEGLSFDLAPRSDAVEQGSAAGHETDAPTLF